MASTARVNFHNLQHMEREVHIISYFSLETDLARELGSWPEFVAGTEYSVDLKSLDSDEAVQVRYVENEDERYVSVKGSGSGSGSLFDRALGRVVYALAGHSDSLMIDRVSVK